MHQINYSLLLLFLLMFRNRCCLHRNNCPPRVAAGSYQLPHIYDYLLADNRSDEGSSGCRNVNKNNNKKL